MRVMVTGGAGYIGTHACVELLLAGHAVLILDNLSGSSKVAIEAVRRVVSRSVGEFSLGFVQGDIRDRALLEKLFRQWRIDAVMHFAASKSASESCESPLEYFDNNVGGTLSLLQAMQCCGVQHLVLSSSAAVYGDGAVRPVCELDVPQPVHPYGRSKWICEQMLADLVQAEAGMRSVVLRYFNPAGAHPSGALGDTPARNSRNLFWWLGQVADKKHPALPVFGTDYPTPDGTGIRDYLHVMDVAQAHVNALAYIASRPVNITLNLGSGCGHSVLDVAGVFEKVSGRAIPLEFQPRRQGDVAYSVADATRAYTVLNWSAQRGIEQICMDAWYWYSSGSTGMGVQKDD